MGHGTRRPRVLVADSDQDNLTLTALRIERAGYEAIVARDGEEALALARSERPDVCVLDVMTAKLTAFDVTRLLREDPSTSSMPVILLTALDAQTVAAQGFGDCADGYVRKPFSPHELRACVHDVLAQRATAQQVAQPATVRPSAAA